MTFIKLLLVFLCVSGTALASNVQNHACYVSGTSTICYQPIAASSLTQNTQTYSNSGTTLTWDQNDGTALTTAPSTYTVKLTKSADGNVTCMLLTFSTATIANTGRVARFGLIASTYRPTTSLNVLVGGIGGGSATNPVLLEVGTDGHVQIDSNAAGSSYTAGNSLSTGSESGAVCWNMN